MTTREKQRALLALIESKTMADITIYGQRHVLAMPVRLLKTCVVIKLKQTYAQYGMSAKNHRIHLVDINNVGKCKEMSL